MTEESWTAELAVVIVNFNTGLYLERCLRSLEAHRGDIEVDVLVIDNASRDGSHARAVAEHPSVRMIENAENVLLAPALNQGIRDTTAPFVLFLDPDAEWWGGTLAGLVRVAREHPEAGIVGPVIRHPDGTMASTGRRFPTVLKAVAAPALGAVFEDGASRGHRSDDGLGATDRAVDWVSGASMLVRREALDRVGLLDEAFPLFGEELDLAARMRDSGWEVVCTPEVEVLHEGGVSTGHTRAAAVERARGLYNYVRKHRATGRRRLLLPLVWAALRLRAELAWIAGRIRRR
jgi:N-acetylglucosaminyl-diphospho-decaprenol L-rhamnosyltransferase